jgi:hypothetical protein
MYYINNKMSETNLDSAINYFLQIYFTEDGSFRSNFDKKYIRFFQKLGFLNNNKGQFSSKSFEEIKEIVKTNSNLNPFYNFLFCQTMCPNGINTIFPLILKGEKSTLPISAFDPIKNRNGDNRGTLCRIMYKNKIYKFMAGNGSMRNVKNSGNIFFGSLCSFGSNKSLHELDNYVKFSVVHKMDGRYVALYISKIMTDSGVPATIMTIHSRKGVIVGSGVFVDGPLEEMGNFSAEFDFTRKERVLISCENNKEKYEYVDKVVFSRHFDFTNDLAKFIPATIQKTSKQNLEEIKIDNLISQQEIKSAFDIAKKLSYLVGLNEMMLVNCEGTKDNMRPLFDKYIVENQDIYPGLFPHPFSTVIYDLSQEYKENVLPKKYLSNPQIFSDNNIEYCRIFDSPSGNAFWNTKEILEGLVQKEVIFENNPKQNLFELVDYANRIMLKFLQSKGKYLDFKESEKTFPGHICEGVILGAHMIDGSFAYMKVKDELFADEEELNMKLESI